MLLGLWIVAGHRNETIRKVGGDMGEVQIKECTVCGLASKGKLPVFGLGKSWRFDMEKEDT